MAKPSMFTGAVTDNIARWVRDGASAADIAERIGCTVGSLRVRCSQLGISLRHPDRRARRQVSLQVTLNQGIMDQFRRSARSRGLPSAALAKAIFEIIIQDNLYDAILDDRRDFGLPRISAASKKIHDYPFSKSPSLGPSR
jgi:hypothetical protein